MIMIDHDLPFGTDVDFRSSKTTYNPKEILKKIYNENSEVTPKLPSSTIRVFLRSTFSGLNFSKCSWSL